MDKYKKNCRKLKYILRGGWIVLLIYHLASQRCRELIDEDVAAYTRKSIEKESMLELLFEESKKPFRNILYYRFKGDECNKRLLRICRLLLPCLDTIEIGGEIDGGLKIIHNYCVISVKKAGKNLTVLQGVTIGKNVDGKLPLIGDNVIVYPNSIIYGGISIGNNVRIGAGSVINKDVADDLTVVGNPFRII